MGATCNDSYVFGDIFGEDADVTKLVHQWCGCRDANNIRLSSLDPILNHLKFIWSPGKVQDFNIMPAFPRGRGNGCQTQRRMNGVDDTNLSATVRWLIRRINKENFSNSAYT